MSETKFTPGPWTVSDYGIDTAAEGHYGVARAADGHVYDEYYSDSATLEFENEADKGLIAAAPDLYHALIDALSVCEYVLSKPDAYDGKFAQLVHAHIDGAKRALAKARGEP